MPDKSVREMNALERQHHSLGAKTVRATLMGSVVLGIVLLIIGLGLYSISLSTQYASHAYYLSRYASLSSTHGADAAALAQEVMETYRSLSEAERAETGTAKYRSRFASAENSEDYAKLLKILPNFADTDDVSDIYLAMFDEESRAVVYVVDPIEKGRLYPGEWEPVSEKYLRKFLDWNGEGELYEIDRTEKYGWMCTAGTPIRNDRGELCAFLMVDVTIGDVLHGMHDYALQITVAMVLVIALLSWAIHRHMKRILVEPINEIAEAAQDYVKDRRSGAGDTEHFSLLNIRTGDEVENLALVMADMERDLKEYEENLTRITSEKERISTELALANRIQADMLPNIFPAFPERKEFDIYASMEPAREVGGDFYDFFLIDDDHLCMFIADVSGKGVPAALFMMASMIILANNAMQGKTPAQILTDTNAMICSNNREEMFVTVWLGILDIPSGRLSACNAGHEYPALKRADGSFALVKDKHGLVIGAMEGVKYQQYELQMQPGDKLFLYTDGVPEASDASQARFGTERTLAALNASREDTPDALLKTVRRAVDGFVRGAEQFDDMTMLCLEYRGPAEKTETKAG